MKTLTLVISASFLILCAAVSRADDESDLHQAAASIDGQAITNEGQTRVLNSISTESGVPVATLQTEKSSTSYGYGELLIANLLASASGKSFDDIVAMRKTEGWGKIANDLGLNLGKIVSKAHRADQAAQHAQNGQSNSANGLNHGFGKGTSHSAGHGRGHGP